MSAECNNLTSGQKQVLVVVADADENRRRNTVCVAQSMGAIAFECPDPSGVVALVRRETPAIILLDAESNESLPGELAGLSDGVLPLVIAIAASDTALGAMATRAALAGHAIDGVVAPVRPGELHARLRIAMARLEDITELQSARDRRADQARMWETLLAFSRRVSDIESYDALLTAIAEAASEMTCAKRVSIMLPDETGEFLSIATAIGFDPAEVGREPIPIGDAVAGRVFTSGNRATADAEQQDEGGSLYGGSTFASIPMASTVIDIEHERVGVLNITDRAEDRPFQPWELEFIDLLGNIAGSAIDDLRTRREREESRDSIVTALATLAECRDSDTGLHVERVTRFSLLLALDLRANSAYGAQIDEVFLTNLRRAAPLHDIGKVAIPDAVLLKPGALTLPEMSVMRTHAAKGRDTIRSVTRRSSANAFLRMAEEITGAHHEWWDGNGYPDGIAGSAIPLSARLVAIADVYDAVTSERVYKKAMTHETARDIIVENRGVQFDPELVDAFIRCEEEFRQLADDLHDDRAFDLDADRIRRDVA